ncbi:hypothetical protein [Mariniflexile sp.]|uniref:hypothetical protein n=1 Tax=Mariniflexile sp. TaxID=1979402 RepID=UPI0040474E1D
MKTNFILLSFFALVTLNCTNGEKNADQSLVKDTAETQTTLQTKNQDSINYYNSKLGLLRNEKDSKTQLINKVSKQRDSMQMLLTQLETSLKSINDKKINPGIEGVNSKLDQLKGQKENFEEQTSLQKKEVALATKKIEILKEEKDVYLEQKKALYDKGAHPSAFIVVDSLLNGINSKILIQNDVVKNINRNVADAEEQIIRITGQRDVLSKKIRNNYDTQLILSEFNADEKNRLETQLAKVNENLNALLAEASSLDTDYKLLASKTSQFSTIETNTTNDSLSENDNNSEENKSGKTSIALVTIIVLGALMALFYIIGKRRKNKKTNVKK